MSANVGLVRSIFAAWERGEYGATKWADPEIEFVVADGPSRGRRTGLAGMAESVRADLEPFRDASQAAEAWSELSDDVKEYDREAVRSIDPALTACGWGVTDA